MRSQVVGSDGVRGRRASGRTRQVRPWLDRAVRHKHIDLVQGRARGILSLFIAFIVSAWTLLSRMAVVLYYMAER